MQLQIFTALTLLLGSALAAPACVARGYATFYDDHHCQTNGGTAVSMANPGCLANEYNRNSIYIQSPCIGDPSMVWSPGNNCNCQNDCALVPTNQGCWDLNGHRGASSFRFIGGNCAANNC
ncbi:hypothetical protein DL546_005416 [Coniochaeta pulveracea]|uniref:Uncharacterized protein n=1 Tax=Coniochaeta pulveracea TaxID=177199 RepID=A0A420Y5Q4_9PEZI|nr:hypothetical protein DL546_005416 [Coniochaeta pulveracea]